MTEDWQHAADRLAAEARDRGRPNDWFEQLYAAAGRGATSTPWNRDHPYPALADWARRADLSGNDRRAVVVGCGLGADAEYAASLGYRTTAFDLAPSAVEEARRRHPESTVDYRVANLLDLPDDWAGAFDLVIEIFTVQAMSRELHAAAARTVAGLVAPGGTLVAIGAVAAGDLPGVDGPPWPLTRREIDEFRIPGLREEAFDQMDVGGAPRWRLVLTS